MDGGHIVVNRWVTTEVWDHIVWVSVESGPEGLDLTVNPTPICYLKTLGEDAHVKS